MEPPNSGRLYIRPAASIEVSRSNIHNIYSIQKPKNIPVLYQEELPMPMGGSVPRRARRKGPLLISKGLDRLPSIDRGSQNLSEISMKLPDIKSSKYSRDSTNELTINYTEDRKAKLRAKLEALY